MVNRIKFYFDENISYSIVFGLCYCSFDVIIILEIGLLGVFD